DCEFDGARDDGVEQRVENREPENRVIPEPLVILKADETAAATDPLIGEAHPDTEAEGIGEEQDEECRGRQHEPKRQEIAVVLEPRPQRRRLDARRRHGHGCLKGCHLAPIPLPGKYARPCICINAGAPPGFPLNRGRRALRGGFGIRLQIRRGSSKRMSNPKTTPESISYSVPLVLTFVNEPAA